ncbi:HlyD family efflux transporter periplasmic adaptor subunit [Shinella daejeonensis]|uniref:HlyD family efflux transporter periplasmic adaptor subunit n=1 Tax=Shinella daejeonensis TaxID=659017 RepID=UPI0020C74B4E|nr:HlyD family efflux transporter periplasmic adaptor subunit [Shinella daejeonensis]MCP8894878.1 HlyD family efflux transporter periplasmic adaptor subunit [Shinella daejeonensis]
MKKILMAVLIAALAVGGWWWWTGLETADTGEIVLQGNVDIRQVSLAFDGSGRIVELRAEEGDRVTAGQIIGMIDTGILELQARHAEALVAAQRQTVLRLQNGSRPEEVAQARALLASAEASAARAEQDLARTSRLRSSGTSSTQAVDQARAEAESARASVEQARAGLDLIEAGPRPEEIAGAAADLKAAEANLALLHHQIDQGTLRAPVDALVRSRLLEPGDQATSQRPVFALALTKPKWVRVYVSEPDLGRIRPGMAAQVFTDSDPDQPIGGRVGYISAVAEFTPKSVQTEELRTSLVYEVRVIVDDEAGSLRLGQPVTVRLPADTTP